MTEAALALALSIAAAGGADCRWPQPLVVDPAATRLAISSDVSFGRFDDASRSVVLARVLEAPVCNAFVRPVKARNNQTHGCSRFRVTSTPQVPHHRGRLSDAVRLRLRTGLQERARELRLTSIDTPDPRIPGASWKGDGSVRSAAV